MVAGSPSAVPSTYADVSLSMDMTGTAPASPTAPTPKAPAPAMDVMSCVDSAMTSTSCAALTSADLPMKAFVLLSTTVTSAAGPRPTWPLMETAAPMPRWRKSVPAATSTDWPSPAEIWSSLIFAP